MIQAGFRANDEPPWITMSLDRATARCPSGVSVWTRNCSTSRTHIPRMNTAKPSRARRLQKALRATRTLFGRYAPAPYLSSPSRSRVASSSCLVSLSMALETSDTCADASSHAPRSTPSRMPGSVFTP